MSDRFPPLRPQAPQSVRRAPPGTAAIDMTVLAALVFLAALALL
ncbi:hypothetical protein [Tabrizicola sp.]|jgi:hypothetical protein|nr:hypothetical protein [Tabrizicola sp.]